MGAPGAAPAADGAEEAAGLTPPPAGRWAYPFLKDEESRNVRHAKLVHDNRVGLYSIVTRGAEIGVVLRPHKGKDGRYVVSMSRFAKDQIRVDRYQDLYGWLSKGYKIRMSAPTPPITERQA
jgi:hypothetical protein